MNAVDKAFARYNWLIEELGPLKQHPDIEIYEPFYSYDRDILYVDVAPRSPPKWAKTAYKFASHEGMKYDRDSSVYGIDGQPRVSYSGLVWARCIEDFLDGSKVAFHIFSEQPLHREAEEQLAKLYSIFRERDNLEPMEVFRRYFRP